MQPDPRDDARQADVERRVQDAVEMSDEQLVEAKRYHHQQLVLSLSDTAVGLIYLALFAFWLAWPLDGWLHYQLAVENDWLRLLLFLTIFGVSSAVVTFPLDYLQGFVLEHRYQLSRQTFRRWFSRHLLQAALGLAFSLVLLCGLMLIIRATGPAWWLVAAGGMFLVSVVLGQLAPVLILPMFYKLEPVRDEQLTERLETLMQGTSLRLAGVYRMSLSRETAKANAMLAGLGRTRRVILGDTLLDGFSPEEIEVVFAHEIGHHVHRHIPKLIAAGILFSLGGFLLCDLVIRQGGAWQAWSADYAQFPVAGLPLLLLTLTVYFLAIEWVRNALSRHFERQCDRYALQRTQNAAAYRSAFLKLAKINKADPQPPRLEVLLLHDHPPIAERLAMADRHS